MDGFFISIQYLLFGGFLLPILASKLLFFYYILLYSTKTLLATLCFSFVVVGYTIINLM